MPWAKFVNRSIGNSHQKIIIWNIFKIFDVLIQINDHFYFCLQRLVGE